MHTMKEPRWGVALATCLLVLSGSSAATTLFDDDFNDGNANGWAEFDGVFSVTGGSYRIESIGFFNDARALNGSPLLDDFVLEADFNMLNREKTAFLFRATDIQSGTDAGKYYQFEVIASQDLVQFCEIDFSDGACSILATAPLVVSDNAWHQLELEVIGDSATAFIDSSVVLSVSGLTKYHSGQIGLKTINSGVTLFDNIHVIAVPEPSTSILLGTGLLFLARYRH
ncbi:MAG: family 16 glycoside hydrolase [Myxococcota bacterium]